MMEKVPFDLYSPIHYTEPIQSQCAVLAILYSLYTDTFRIKHIIMHRIYHFNGNCTHELEHRA